jgi:hypothetical protein
MARTGDGANFTPTIAMGLRLNTVGVCGALGVEPPGLSHGELVNQNFFTLDGHTHAPGFGVPVPTSGININADLGFAGFNATSLRSTRYTPITLASLVAADVGCLIVSGVDLYYVDRNGSQIRLTSAGGIAGTPGSISGLASPAAVSYTPASKLFTFTSSSGFVANMSTGPISIGEATVSGGFAATLKVPGALASSYNLTLPAALPGATKILTLDGTGAIGATYDLDNTTLQVSAGLLGVKNGGIGNAQLAAGAAVANIGTNALARSQLPLVGQQISASCGTFTTTSSASVAVTNLSVTLTTTGRPVLLILEPDGSFGASISSSSFHAWFIQFMRGATTLGQLTAAAAANTIFGQQMFYLDVVAAGTYTYSVQASILSGDTLSVQNYRLAAYEL